ncbi:10552_t:CDS:1, partial [Acaulospora colombiana]
ACPNPDIYVRIDFEDQLGWHDDLKPIIFAGECKTEKTRSKNTPAQLAVAFHATLIILILYYLDNRSSGSDPLPAWLFLYGIEYTEHGFFVHVHFPYYHFDGPNPGWGFVSAKFTDEFSKVFKNGDTDLRLSALALLFRMRSQAMFVMEKLKEWKRAPRVLSVLQRQAAAPDSLAGTSGESPKRKKGPRVTL